MNCNTLQKTNSSVPEMRVKRNQGIEILKTEQGKQVTRVTILLTVLGVQPHNSSVFPERTECLETRYGKEGAATCDKYRKKSRGF